MTHLHLAADHPNEAFDRGAVHVLTLTAQDPRLALTALQAGLATTAAELSGLTLNALGQVAEATLRLTRLSCAEARSFSDRLAAEPGVLSARVEHHLFRP
jgi:hypothetical protein